MGGVLLVKWHGGADFEDVVVWTVCADQDAVFAHSVYDSVGVQSRGFQIAKKFDAEK